MPKDDAIIQEVRGARRCGHGAPSRASQLIVAYVGRSGLDPGRA